MSLDTMTSVLLVAQTEALAQRATAVLEAGTFEVAVATQSFLPSTLRPRAVVVVAEVLAGPWCLAVSDLVRTRRWRRRTIVVAPFTGENLEVVRKRRLSALYPLSQLDGEFAKTLARFADSSSWEDRASARMQAMLGVTDHLCASFVSEAFSYGPPCPTVTEVCRRGLYTSPSNMRSRWRRRGLPGSPKAVLDRIVALRFGELRWRGTSVGEACAALGIHRTTMLRLTRRVAGSTPGEIERDGLWGVFEEWANRARQGS